MIPIYKPYLPKSCLKYAHDALDSTWISSQGEYIEKATELLCDILQVKHVLLTNNGTSACHLVAETVKNEGITKVIIPDNVYVAAWNSFLYNRNFTDGLIKVGTDYNTWNMDLVELDNLINPFEAVLIVHNLGNIINVPELKKKYPYTTFVEDNCEGLFGVYDGHFSGTQSLCSSFSFFANKTITSGEGGAFVTNNTGIYEHAKKAHGQGMTKTRYIHDILGYNYRMTNIQAAILYGQLLIKDRIIDLKDAIFSYYREELKDLENIEFQQTDENTIKADWIFAVKFTNDTNYKKAKEFFDSRGIETRPMFYPINYHKHLQGYGMTSLFSKKLSEHVVMFPSYPDLTIKEQDHIIESIKCYSTL